MVSEISKIQSATQFLISPSSNEFDVATVPKKLKWLSVERILKGNLESRGWISEVMLLVERLPEDFTLDDIYPFDSYLENLFPSNKHIRDKIRQQLQPVLHQFSVQIVVEQD